MPDDACMRPDGGAVASVCESVESGPASVVFIELLDKVEVVELVVPCDSAMLVPVAVGCKIDVSVGETCDDESGSLRPPVGDRDEKRLVVTSSVFGGSEKAKSRPVSVGMRREKSNGILHAA